MKERPILFSAPMVRALLDGSKTQTRRVVKTAMALELTERGGFAYADRKGKRWMCGIGSDHAGTMRNFTRSHCPYGQPCDQLWVRETFQPTFAPGVEHGAADWGTGEGYQPRYMATDKRVEWIDADDNITDRCKPAIHMPRWASRITLEITAVRVERLQDISEQDAVSEGIEKTAHGFWSTYGRADVDGTYSPRTSYKMLWELINGPGSWDANPWVWVLEFKRVLPPQCIPENCGSGHCSCIECLKDPA